MKTLISRPTRSPSPATAATAADGQTPAKRRPPRTPTDKENSDPALQSGAGHPDLHSSPFKSPSPSPSPASTQTRSLPPRPPRKKICFGTKLDAAASAADDAAGPDSGVQVVVRIRPMSPREVENREDAIVRAVAPNSVSIAGLDFTYDSVVDVGETQEDVFRLIGLPLVENCLAGFNSSIFAYGQTGSGKTYTMWGPPSLLSEESALNGESGLTPRVFDRLFSRMEEEKLKHQDRQLTYQCRCSFLQIYNEQIIDLLDPSETNLQIREDVRTGVYVESLMEEFVFSTKDVRQLLIKGMANRRTGATSVNADSSRSHCVFTCVIKSQSQCTGNASTSIKISRINLVDLAGSERQKLTNAAGDRLKEAGSINRSLSQLGNVINILAEISQTGKQRHIPYRDSRLTFLLQESLGGNAKLAMLCAISPSQSCKSESLSTLRFAQRAKAIKNKAIVNEIKHDDVNALREQIRQLKDELCRMKSGNSPGGGGYSTAGIARRSLNLLKMSLCYPAKLPTIKDDSDVEMEIDENDVEKLGSQAGFALSSVEEKELNSLENTPEAIRNSCSNDLAFVATTSNKVQEVRHDEISKSRLDLAASIHKGLQILENNHNIILSRNSSPLGHNIGSSAAQSLLSSAKVDVGVQTEPDKHDVPEDSLAITLASSCLNDISADDNKETPEAANMQLVPVPRSPAREMNITNLKAAEKVLVGSIRREMELEERCAKQTAEIRLLNRLVEQYKQERECNSMIVRTHEDKISRLERLMDGVLPSDEFMGEELVSLRNEHKLLKKKYDEHPEVLRLNIELGRAQEELNKYNSFFNMEEREVLIEEIQDLRDNLQHYICPPGNPRADHALLPLEAIPETTEEEMGANVKNDCHCQMEATLMEELQSELEKSRALADRLHIELDAERKCCGELKDALEAAMQGHARILEQYADLQEKHTALLAMHRRINDGIEDVKKAAVKAGVKGAESRFINSLALEISILNAERDKERQYWRNENKGLQEQIRDTAEAVQAAGELLVRLKEAEEAASLYQRHAATAEHETEKAYQEIDNLKKNYDEQIIALKQLLADSRLMNESVRAAELNNHAERSMLDRMNATPAYQSFRPEFDTFRPDVTGDASDSPRSYYYSYDRCNY